MWMMCVLHIRISIKEQYIKELQFNTIECKFIYPQPNNYKFTNTTTDPGLVPHTQRQILACSKTSKQQAQS